MQATSVHELVQTRLCAALSCTEDADPGSYFCGACLAKHERGEEVVLHTPAPPPRRRRMAKAAQRDHLSQCEIEVLVLAARGLNNNAIARTTCRSPETVKSHKRNILAVLEARNTAHAVAIAFRRGLFT